MYHNIVIGIPLADPAQLIAADETDWNETELSRTLYTDTRFLPAVLKEAGVVNSTSEIKRNRPELWKAVAEPDCFWIEWGKKKVFVIVGEEKEHHKEEL